MLSGMEREIEMTSGENNQLLPFGIKVENGRL
jgi:hypothetical protein